MKRFVWTLFWLVAAVQADAEGLLGESVYTDLSLDAEECPVVKADPETYYSLNRCQGPAGYALLVEYADDRMSAIIQTPDGKDHPLRFTELISNGFSTIGAKAEWRLHREGGEAVPHGLILRFNPEEPQGIISYLTLSQISAQDACLADVIPPTEFANERARKAVDAAAERPCWGPPPNADEELELLYAAAVAGDAYAQREVGFQFQNGKGMPRDLNQALHWYRRAAEQGHDVAQNDLGYLYGNGIGVNKDLEVAARWYDKAARQGNMVAVANLAALGVTPPSPLAGVACPEVLNTRQMASNDLSDWLASDDGSPGPLLHVSFYQGPPEQAQALEHDQYLEDPDNQEAAGYWRFIPGDEGLSLGQVWVVCAYASTRVRLSRQLPVGLTGCSVTYSTRLKLHDFPIVLGMECR